MLEIEPLDYLYPLILNRSLVKALGYHATAVLQTICEEFLHDPIKQKTLREDAHEFVWKMYCVPNSARQSVQAHWESVMSRSVLARFVLEEDELERPL